jgi:putative endonuclease
MPGRFFVSTRPENIRRPSESWDPVTLTAYELSVCSTNADVRKCRRSVRSEPWPIRLPSGKPKNGSLYIGMTNDLIRRVHEHKQGLVAGFTQKYKIRILVYVEVFDSAYDAIAREKQLKTWNRAWKIALTQAENPYWNDLYRQFV